MRGTSSHACSGELLLWQPRHCQNNMEWARQALPWGVTTWVPRVPRFHIEPWSAACARPCEQTMVSIGTTPPQPHVVLPLRHGPSCRGRPSRDGPGRNVDTPLPREVGVPTFSTRLYIYIYHHYLGWWLQLPPSRGRHDMLDTQCHAPKEWWRYMDDDRHPCTREEKAKKK